MSAPGVTQVRGWSADAPASASASSLLVCVLGGSGFDLVRPSSYKVLSLPGLAWSGLANRPVPLTLETKRLFRTEVAHSYRTRSMLGSGILFGSIRRISDLYTNQISTQQSVKFPSTERSPWKQLLFLERSSIRIKPGPALQR